MGTLPSTAYDAVVDHAIDRAPRECCGNRSGSRDGPTTSVDTVYRTANVACAHPFVGAWRWTDGEFEPEVLAVGST